MAGIGVYKRVSTDKQTTASQSVDLDAWAAGQEGVIIYEDQATGTNMDRPGFARLLADIRCGKVKTLVVWRLDRLGRTMLGLSALFDELRRLGVNLISLRDGVDLSTPAGRLMANVIASVAVYESEIRGERMRAGIAARRAKGKRWGGKPAGCKAKKTKEAEGAVRQLKAGGHTVANISRLLGLSRGTVYSCLESGAA